MAEAYRKLHPLEYHSKFVSQGIRAQDARSTQQCRPTSLTAGVVSSADGSAVARVGSTKVATGVKAEVMHPTEDAPMCGRLEVNVIFPPVCSAKYGPGRPPDEALALSQLLTRSVVRAGLLHLTQLGIEKGQAAWVLKADVVCVDHDGNVGDAALLALIGALSNTTLPVVAVGSDHVVTIPDPEDRVPLVLSDVASSLTVAVVAGVLVVDPTAEEEAVCTSTVTVIHTGKGKLCGAHKAGGSAIADTDLLACIALGEQRAKQLQPLFQSLAAASGGAAGAGAGDAVALQDITMTATGGAGAGAGASSSS